MDKPISLLERVEDLATLWRNRSITLNQAANLVPSDELKKRLSESATAYRQCSEELSEFMGGKAGPTTEGH